jgi:predicted nucleotidyltransferase
VVRAIIKPIRSRQRSIATSLPANFPRRELILGLARRLAAHPAIERVWLFGSRARGDQFPRSDIDLAIEAPGMGRYDWLKIALDFEDEAPTLLSIDLIRLEGAPEHLRQDIREEGILLYERARAQAPV